MTSILLVDNLSRMLDIKSIILCFGLKLSIQLKLHLFRQGQSYEIIENNTTYATSA